MERIYIFKRFERFWHWSQALLIILMMVTGFEIHGSWSLLGYGDASELHTSAAWALIALWLFAIFWHFTTGEWRQYIPTTENLVAMLRYYLSGIFTHAPHPFHPTRLTKHNPLQRLAYLGVKLMINPLIWLSGLAYLYYNEINAAGFGLDLGLVATLHTIGAFLMLAFLVVHVYVITTGDTWSSQLKAMITGWEEIEDPQEGVKP
ncbi:cytochrome b/b6 domain-containing protein [Aromatoleum toluclasticum]|uniref:cytochrome b/b6 domain-containing protein n=1 Tax=Aromatoleum toluclasticum TaxID=92003 RepID=UPI001D18A2CF|nr:cytochrome b/b6 domain-containing protein [Aromatoleum toluclasticum]MCC4116521.1 cytochrome b/b6 domain-containing protein [Aromatoleum toluclasticum]